MISSVQRGAAFAVEELVFTLLALCAGFSGEGWSKDRKNGNNRVKKLRHIYKTPPVIAARSEAKSQNPDAAWILRYQAG
jgi:hypothetical protein